MGAMARTTSAKNDSLLKNYLNSTAATNNTDEGKALGSQIYKWNGFFWLNKFFCFSRVSDLSDSLLHAITIFSMNKILPWESSRDLPWGNKPCKRISQSFCWCLKWYWDLVIFCLFIYLFHKRPFFHKTLFSKFELLVPFLYLSIKILK